MKSSGIGSPNRSQGFNAESEPAWSDLHTTDSRGPTHRGSFASDALQRAPRPASTQTTAGTFATRSRGGSPVHQTRAGQTGAPSASNAASSARTAATSNVFELLRAGALPTHRIAQAELEGFSDSEESALEPMVHMILEALGPIFPPGHDDIRITRKTLSRDLARTVFYGKAADIELDLDAHLDKGKTVLDALTCARIAQTLTHEIMLHTRKEFQEYFSTKKFRGPVEDAKDIRKRVCLRHATSIFTRTIWSLEDLRQRRGVNSLNHGQKKSKGWRRTRQRGFHYRKKNVPSFVNGRPSIC